MTTFADSITFVPNDTATISQTVVSGFGTKVGQNLTIQAQPGQAQQGFKANNNGGNLLLSSGVAGTGGAGGAALPGNIQLQIGGISIAQVDVNKFYTLKGRSRNETKVTANYTVLKTDDIIAVGPITRPITLVLPSSPNIGDSYSIKDKTGTCATYNIVISGNANNIDGFPYYVMSNNYSSLDLTFTGPDWSVT